ncbi:beta-galactosidase [Echinimonas agarilytica]|uniref:Beta-galactosidase n=1 Tax=Echinimonas agarilytica TaxID=1215918 RepID=A0AA41W8E4_9GAMM|nr:beta-galactosidase [Echinimonas agarilytica]MCM2680869.1 beta-galactosidase [Echinimonas agarilytica]
MDSLKPNHALVMAAATLLLTGTMSGCMSEDSSSQKTPAALGGLAINFDDGVPSDLLKFENTDFETVKTSQANNAVALHFQSKDNQEASFAFEPKKPWNWEGLSDFAFAIDISNTSDTSTHLYVTAKDTSGAAHNRSMVVPSQSSNTYYMVLRGDDLNIETGIRSNPKKWISEHEPIIWRYGTKNIDLSQVESIKFSVRGLLADKSIVIDNIRLIQAEAQDKDYLVGLVDEFGQNAKLDFDGKVNSVEALIERSQQEQSKLSNHPMQGRSKFSGWSEGPKLDGTGYFRVEKYQGKWSLVDPEGYLFFSTGIANIRMANTSTITGYDFDESLLPGRDANDLTPEDSKGLNRAPEAAVKSRYVSSKLRADMFEWLPDYSEPLAANFGYRNTVHVGAVEKGETFSFYRANLERKFEETDNAKLMNKWRDTTIDRMLTWGFTSFGNWVDPIFYQEDRIPYFANGWIIGNYKTVSSGNDYWSPLPDPFDPEFSERASKTVAQIALEVKDNPWCVGVFVDNEKSWGSMNSNETRYAIAINTLKLPSKESPTKAEFDKLMQAKYVSVDALNKAWGTDIASWQGFAEGAELTQFTDQALADLSVMMTHYAEQYFKVVAEMMDKHMPNHLYLGARFADWGMTPEVRFAAAKYADVVSYNYYKEGINSDFWTFLKDIDRPSIIGEFHNGSVDTGLLNPGLVHAESQYDRGQKYVDYMQTVVDNPYFVGAHWFQYIDSPLTGRAYDGENYNVGFVSVTDLPSEPLVKAATDFNRQLYRTRFSQ